MDLTKCKEQIAAGSACLGIELGSTRIKAVLIGSDFTPIASGDHGWENRYENGISRHTPVSLPMSSANTASS